MRRKNQLTFFITLSLILCLIPFSQVLAQTDSVMAQGSPFFKTNSSKKFWMGANYRAEWLTPVKAPVFNMSTELGGLIPVRKGGGKQTKSLRLEASDGRQYSLRSIQKFITAKTLPADLQSEAAEDLVQDGVSASYTYAALSIPPLAEAAGVPYNKVKLVYIPDDPKLGEFREEFRNMLALFEERLPEYVDKGFDTDEVADKLEKDNDNEADQQALLKARILDMFVMDFDRHEDQWQWGSVDKEKGNRYFPIPRDRDQAFYTNQGVIPGIAKWPWIVPQLEGFKAKAHNINRFNFAARNLDRFFLNGLSEDDWKKEVEAFLPTMTDNVIENALAQQPAAVRDISGGKIIQILKERRNHLESEMMQYYRFLAKIVDITGSDKHELFDIDRKPDGKIQVQVFKVNSEGETSTKMYDRTFDPSVTKELRLYGFGNDDKFLVKGGHSPIRIRMIGGGGQDNFENTSSANGGIIYDKQTKKNSVLGKFTNKFSRDSNVNSYNRLYYKYDQVIPFVTFNYNRDDGLYIGFSLKFIKQGFRKDPYKTSQEFMVSHSLATKAFNFRYYAEYIGVLGKTGDILTDLDIKAPDNTTNFFGYGDQSVYDKSKPGKFRYYRARYNMGDISLLLRKRFSDKVMFTLGPTFEFSKLDSGDNINKYIIMTADNGLDPDLLYAKQSFLGGRFSFSVDTRDDKVLPQKGVNFVSSIRYLHGLNDESKSIWQYNSALSVYLKIVHNRLVWANRIGGGTNTGDFAFYQAQYLGSEENLRGYRKYRFSGKSKMFYNSELRWRVANFQTYLFPAAFGFFAFYDAGRIWTEASGSSDRWISGYGGGLWFSPLSRIVFSVAYTVSDEDKLPLIGLGWKF